MAATTVQENKELVKQFLAALGAVQSEKVLDLLDDDLEYWVAGSTPMSGMHTKQDLRGMLGGFTAMFPVPMTIKPFAFTAEGNRVACEAESNGKTVSGRTYHNFYHFVFEFRGGKILKMREYMDTGHAAEVFAA